MNLPNVGTKVAVTYFVTRKRDAWTEDTFGYLVGTVESRKGPLVLSGVVSPDFGPRVSISRCDILSANPLPF